MTAALFKKQMMEVFSWLYQEKGIGKRRSAKGIAGTVVLSLFILVLSAILGWVVALIATKVKHRNIIAVVISLAFIAAYYYFYATVYSFVQNLLLNLDTIGSRLKTVLYPLYHMGLAAEGNILSMLIFTAIVSATVALTYWIMSRSFLKLATANRGAAKAVYKEQTAKVGTVQSALLRKELRRFTGSPNYMLNCGLGMILMPVSAAVLIWKADLVRSFLSIPAIGNYIPLLAAAMICLLTTMNDMAAPSISLEGKNLWIVQALPVSGKQVLRAKLELHLLLTCLPAIPLVCVIEWLIKPDRLNGMMIPVVAAFFIALMAEIELAVNLKIPNLHWTSEITPTKQSAPVAVALFGGWLIVAAVAGCYYLLHPYIGVGTFLLCAAVLFIVADSVLLRWLMGKGAKIFEQLQ